MCVVSDALKLEFMGSSPNLLECLGQHVSQSSQGLLTSDAMYCCYRIAMFQRTLLPPSSLHS
jgi:hypothetical protein